MSVFKRAINIIKSNINANKANSVSFDDIDLSSFSINSAITLYPFSVKCRPSLGCIMSSFSAVKSGQRAVSIKGNSNNVVLGDNEDLFTDEVKAKNVNIISGKPITEPIRVLARVRYRHKEQPATAWQTDDGILHVKFDEPQRAITKGQSLVIFDGDTVLGGGEII